MWVLKVNTKLTTRAIKYGNITVLQTFVPGFCRREILFFKNADRGFEHGIPGRPRFNGFRGGKYQLLAY